MMGHGAKALKTPAIGAAVCTDPEGAKVNTQRWITPSMELMGGSRHLYRIGREERPLHAGVVHHLLSIWMAA
jgi:hypothetical protein